MSNFAPVQSPARATGSAAHSVDHTPQPEGRASHPIVVAEQREAGRWQPRADFRYKGRRLVVKRVFDVAASLLLVVLLAPLLLVIYLSVRATSDGPGLFRQERVGRNGRSFRIVKFRSMYVDAERRLVDDQDLRARYLNGGYKLPLDTDPRITRFGSFLRRSSLDELPQLWNVVKGEMSLVGPRPVLKEELSAYQGYVDAYLLARPGLTGPWQVAGRDAVRFPLRGRFDAEYVDDWSLTTDVVILIRTIPAAIRARGVR